MSISADQRRELAEIANGNGHAPPVESWRPVDLQAALEGRELEPRPSILARDEGDLCFFYEAKRHAIVAEPESAKTFLCLQVGAGELEQGRSFLFFDFESDVRQIVGRLRTLGVSTEAIRDGLIYMRPDEPFTEQAWQDIEEVIQDRSPRVAIFDGTNEAMGLQGLKLTDNDDVATWGRMLPRRLTGLGLLTVETDHVTKDKETRGHWAIGGQAKKAGVDVQYTLRVISHPAPGRDGAVALYVAKDRPGYLRAAQNADKQIAVMRLRSEGERLAISFDAPPDQGGTFRPTFLMARLYEAVCANPGLTTRALRDIVPGKNSAKQTALELLIAEGNIIRKPEGAAQLHYPGEPYSEGNHSGTGSHPVSGNRAPVVPACPSGEPDRFPERGGDRFPGSPPLIGGNREPAPLGTPLTTPEQEAFVNSRSPLSPPGGAFDD